MNRLFPDKLPLVLNTKIQKHKLAAVTGNPGVGDCKLATQRFGYYVKVHFLSVMQFKKVNFHDLVYIALAVK